MIIIIITYNVNLVANSALWQLDRLNCLQCRFYLSNLIEFACLAIVINWKNCGPNSDKAETNEKQVARRLATRAADGSCARDGRRLIHWPRDRWAREAQLAGRRARLPVVVVAACCCCCCGSCARDNYWLGESRIRIWHENKSENENNDDDEKINLILCLLCLLCSQLELAIGGHVDTKLAKARHLEAGRVARRAKIRLRQQHNETQRRLELNHH